MLGKIIASFVATAAQLLGGEDTIAKVLFGPVAEGNFGVFSMDAAGKTTVNQSVGKTTWLTTLNLGGMVQGAGVVLVRMLVNGSQVGKTLSVTIPIGSTLPVEFTHSFDSLSGGDEIEFEFVLDAAGVATDGGTVLIDGTANAAAWVSGAPAKLEIYG